MRFAPAVTPAQEATLLLDTATRASKKMTKHDYYALKRGAADPDGIIRPGMRLSNFDNVEKRMARLVALGCAVPNAHGDWYITETGRLALTI